METGRSSSVYSAYSSVRSIPRTSPSELTISVTTSPQPPWRLTRRRNAVSVIPAMGATANGDRSSTDPIFISVDFHVRRFDDDTDRLPDEIDREHEVRAMRVLPQQPSDHPAQRTMNHLHHHPLANERAGIELHLAADEEP